MTTLCMQDYETTEERRERMLDELKLRFMCERDPDVAKVLWAEIWVLRRGMNTERDRKV